MVTRWSRGFYHFSGFFFQAAYLKLVLSMHSNPSVGLSCSLLCSICSNGSTFRRVPPGLVELGPVPGLTVGDAGGCGERGK